MSLLETFLPSTQRMTLRSFASDNYAGALPEIVRAFAEEAQSPSHAHAYGHDEISRRTRRLMAEIFSHPSLGVYFVFNGTGANVLSILACTDSYHAVICSDISHIVRDESSSPETIAGVRLIAIPTDENGKINIELIEDKLECIGDMHAAQPRMLTIAQPTEYGTVYSLEELRQLSKLAKKYQLYFHIDGARLFNAASFLQCTLREMTTDVGVDILSLGGTKVGLMYGEAVVVFNPLLMPSSDPLKYRHKQMMQLASKQRFIAVQFHTLLHDELWKSSSEHSNAMAQLLQSRLQRLQFASIRITRPVQSNAIFLEIPEPWFEPLSSLFPFYKWRKKNCEVRLMCSFDTSEEDIERFVKKLVELIDESKAICA